MGDTPKEGPAVKCHTSCHREEQKTSSWDMKKRRLSAEIDIDDAGRRSQLLRGSVCREKGARKKL